MHKHRWLMALAMTLPCAFLARAQDPTLAAPAANAQTLEGVTVTGTREQAPLRSTAAAVGVISAAAIQTAGPMHPQQILGQVPGVAINVTNGEGHTTAIRQPFSTAPMYLYLEDGIPTRATGFFNHNALYEVNLPQAGSIEVVKGPGSALYGSDAIGGTVNVLTRAPAAQPALEVGAEAGSFGWRRLLLDGTGATGFDGAGRAALNLTHTDGWRDQTAYDRQSLNLRQDQALGEGGLLKTIVGATRIDQQTGANSPLTWDDYVNNPTKNNYAIAWRKVDALRVSTQYERDLGDALLSLTPYLRSNAMDLNGSFNLSSDPRIEKTRVASLGVLAKWRQDYGGELRPRLIVGLDLERSPGARTEDALNVTFTGAGANRHYTGYTVGNRIYDYEVSYRSASTYVQGELSPSERLRLSAGLRFDSLGYDMSNNIATATTTAGTRIYAQTPSAAIDYTHWSPKLGATLALSPVSSVYVAYSHGFRAPSESQLFRAGSGATVLEATTKAELALALKPVKADQLEVGWRGAAGGWQYDVAAYRLVKRDDLVTQRDPLTNVSTSVNAGQTEHSGVELGLGKALGQAWRVDTALSYAVHRYVDWVTSSANYSGREMEAAPRVLANTRLGWTPRAGTTAQLEWVRLGDYWLEAGNSDAYGKYAGHDVFNLRVSHAVTPAARLYARLMNLADRRYADSASVSSGTPVYSPALPRALYVGVEVAL